MTGCNRSRFSSRGCSRSRAIHASTIFGDGDGAGTSWELRHGEVAAPAGEIENGRLAQVERTLAKLPIDQRELISLMRENDWSYGDLARITGVSASAVKSRLFRARSRLRALIDGDES